MPDQPSPPASDLTASIRDRIAQTLAALDATSSRDLERWVLVSVQANRPLMFPMIDGDVVGPPRLTLRAEDATRFPTHRAASAVADTLIAEDGTGAAKAVHLRDAFRWLLHDLQQHVQQPEPRPDTGASQGKLFE